MQIIQLQTKDNANKVLFQKIRHISYRKVDLFMVKKCFKSVLSRLVEKQRCANKLTLSFCVGTYIAFSPFVGFHTALVFFLSWVFSLEYAAVLAAAWLINNPWTMFPIYAFTYGSGQFILGSLCGIDTLAYNPVLPACIQPITHWFSSSTGLSNLSFWSFIFGGNLIGLCAAAMMYPIVKPLFKKLINEKNVQPYGKPEVIEQNENYCPK